MEQKRAKFTTVGKVITIKSVIHTSSKTITTENINNLENCTIAIIALGNLTQKIEGTNYNSSNLVTRHHKYHNKTRTKSCP